VATELPDAIDLRRSIRARLTAEQAKQEDEIQAHALWEQLSLEVNQAADQNQWSTMFSTGTDIFDFLALPLVRSLLLRKGFTVDKIGGDAFDCDMRVVSWRAADHD